MTNPKGGASRLERAARKAAEREDAEFVRRMKLYVRGKYKPRGEFVSTDVREESLLRFAQSYGRRLLREAAELVWDCHHTEDQRETCFDCENRAKILALSTKAGARRKSK